MERPSPDVLDEFLDRNAEVFGSYDEAWRRAEVEFGVTTPPTEDLLSSAIMARIAEPEVASVRPEPEILTRIAIVEGIGELTQLRKDIIAGLIAGTIPPEQAGPAFKAVSKRQRRLGLVA